MKIVEWEELPAEMQNDAVRKYYDILKKKKASVFFKRMFDIVVSAIMLVVDYIPDAVDWIVKQLEKLESEIRGKLQSVLGISPKVKLVAPKSIVRSEGKAVRIIDKRKI